jgi:hypothetical protein
MDELKVVTDKLKDAKDIDKNSFKEIICKIAEILESLYNSLPPEIPLVVKEVLYLLMATAESLCKILSD